ncbi:MAG TPA: magnesium transporter CorA family protein [Propylenella sp.]|nr:magnesium transporter CorA family protein [Propylenella sp.]
MLALYGLRDERLIALGSDAELLADAVWIDLLHPSAEEEARVERRLGIDVPTREEMAEIEISSRLYRENETLFMTAVLLMGTQGPQPQACPVSFILTKGTLVTVRYAEPSVFRTFLQQAQRTDLGLQHADGVFAALLEAIIDRTADILERVGAETDAVSRTVFQPEAQASVSRDYKAILKRIGLNGDLNSKVRESLVSIGRLVNFLSAECGDLQPGLRERTDTMAADIRSLTDHASYVAGTTVFLLDATLGLINIEQNAIIKIVSVVSVLVMPPMLIASIYGMNFRFMPELDWRVGYPLALAAMAIAVIIPYWVFKRRGWL